MNKKANVFDNIFLYVFLGLVIAGLITLLMDLSWKGFFISLILCELVSLGIFAFKVYNSKVDSSIKYHSLPECRKYCIDWLKHNNSLNVKSFSNVTDSEEGISNYGLPFKRNSVLVDNSRIYFGVFISDDVFPKYIFIALNTEIVDNDSTFSDLIEYQQFPSNLSSDKLDVLKYRMCNSKADVPIITKAQGYTQRVDPSGVITTNKEERTNADDLFDDEKKDSDVKK